MFRLVYDGRSFRWGNFSWSRGVPLKGELCERSIWFGIHTLGHRNSKRHCFFNINGKKEQKGIHDILLHSVPIFLMSFGFTIQYMVLLIKVGAESLWWFYVVAAVLGFLIANLLIYLDKSKLHTVFIGLGAVLIVLSWILIVVANSADGNYIITYRNKLRGSFSIKTMVGTFQTLGIMIFLLMYGFLLKLRFGGEE